MSAAATKIAGTALGAAVAVAAIWGSVVFAKSGHPVLAFLCGAGGVGAGAGIAHMSIRGGRPYSGAELRGQLTDESTATVH